MVTSKITLITRVGGKSGVHHYSKNITRELKKLCDINHVEIKIRDKPLNLPYIQAKLLTTRIRTPVVHSIDIFNIHLRTNILTLFDLLQLNSSFIKRNVFRLFLSRLKSMKKIITISNQVANQIMDVVNVDEDRIHTIYCGIDHSTFYPSKDKPPRISNDKCNLLFVGAFQKRKGIKLILEALRYLDSSKYRFIRIGPIAEPMYYRECLEIAKKSNVDLIELGYQPTSTLRDYYSHADLFVFPSYSEGFGMPPMEALACGTNCVVSDLPVFKEIYQDVVFYSRLEPEELAETIEYAYSHRRDKSVLVEFARRFSWHRAAEETIKVYKEVLGDQC